mmetsp:Transcript_91333/g.197569  ORF Transcript_91333/g.197569 Transcript_91333/m.197569 type:complete len:140 (+) Transcript_91333:23-442(+)
MSEEISVFKVMDKVKQSLLKRGKFGIRRIGRIFRQMDSFDGNNKLDRKEFGTGLKEAGVDNLNKEETECLFKAMDKNGDGMVDFDEFLVAIRGQMNERRTDISLKAFLKMDRDCSGFITIVDLKGVYNVKHHPKVQSGE